MSEREEFEEWATKQRRLPLDSDPIDLMWAAWQAARASRWRSPGEFGEDDESGSVWGWYEGAGHPVRTSFAFGYWDGTDGAPLAWCRTIRPDPPTTEELERINAKG